MRPETTAAIRAVRIAQTLADSRAGADNITSKGGIDLVTSTDVACEDAIRAELLRAFPEYNVIGEERGGDPQPGVPYWLVDPICGTRPFASNVPLYCSNIALVENSDVTVAAIGIGKTGEVLFAEKGAGAWIRTGNDDQRAAANAQSNTIWIDGRTEQAANVVRDAMLTNRWYVWQFSSTLSYAYVALGRISGVLQFGSNSFRDPFGSVHSSAGCFIAREAGAIVTDLNSGVPWTLASRSHLIAATAELHSDLMALAQKNK